MRFVRLVCLAIGFLWLSVSFAQARVNIEINLDSQTMHVTSAGGADYEWPVSTGRSGHLTPRGTFYPQRMEVMTYSIPYHHAPMPHSIFFTGGYAIHGTYEVASLGSPASHGCVRLAPQNAAALFEMVRHEGATISIHGAAPVSQIYASAGHRHHLMHLAKYTAHHHHHRLTTLASADVQAGSFANLVAPIGQ